MAKFVEYIVRNSKENLFAPATKIKRKLKVGASAETIHRHFGEHDLAIHSPRKEPIINKKAYPPQAKLCE